MPQTETIEREGVDEGAEPDVEISIRNLTKTFGPQTVFDDISFDIPMGKITLILGPSGTGKSVFLKHIMGLLKPDRGEIWIDGKNVPALPHRELYRIRRKFGVLFQDGALFGSMSIYDNVAFPLREHTKKGEREIREIVTEKLEMVGLRGAEKKLPGQISGGMKKRAGLARALVLDPDIIMFDEPDSGLDPVRTAFLNELILDLSEQLGSTIIVVTHDIATARRIADYIGMLYARHLVRFGPAKEMFESDIAVVRQFLSGDTRGPIGMSEESDRTKAVSTSGMSADETEELEGEAEQEWRRREAERDQRAEPGSEETRRVGGNGDRPAPIASVPAPVFSPEEPTVPEAETSEASPASVDTPEDEPADTTPGTAQRKEWRDPAARGDQERPEGVLGWLQKRYERMWKWSGSRGVGG